MGDPRDPSKSSDPNWIPEFKEKIDLLIMVTGDSFEGIAGRVEGIERIFGITTEQSSVKQIIALDGNVRPGIHKGHEQSVLRGF